MTVSDFIMGPPAGGSIKKCSNVRLPPDPASARKSQCPVMSEVTDGGFKGLKDTISDLLIQVQTKAISDVRISDDELRIISYIGIPTILDSLQTFDVPEGYAYIRDISAIAATSLVINMLRQVEAKISAMNIPSESLSGRRQDLTRLSENLTNQVKSCL
nr:hypothetical protein [Escherichia coli]